DLSWGRVSAAAGYWIQVFQYQGATTDEKIANGLPSPLATGRLIDQFVAYVPAPDTSYKIGVSTGAQIIAKKTIIVNGLYLVRITAVDAAGRLVGFSYGDGDAAIFSSSYLIYPLGAFAIQPKRPTPVPE